MSIRVGNPNDVVIIDSGKPVKGRKPSEIYTNDIVPHTLTSAILADGRTSLACAAEGSIFVSYSKPPQICIKVFSMATSSAASERNFSTMGFVHSKLRNCRFFGIVGFH